METTNATRGNRMKLEQVEAALAGLLAETLRRGFHGKALLELVISRRDNSIFAANGGTN